MNQPFAETRLQGYIASTDPARMDLNAIHAYLTRSYWSPGISKELVQRAMANSLGIGLFTEKWEQVGFARAITDCTTFAYLADVYVLEEYRGKGLGRWMLQSLLAHSSLQGLRRIVLVTRDAHKLYEPLGFKPLARPEGYMELHTPRDYSKSPKG